MKTILAIMCLLIVTNVFATNLTRGEMIILYNINSSLSNIKDSMNTVANETSNRLEQKESLRYFEIEKSEILVAENCGAIGGLFGATKLLYANQFKQYAYILNKIDSKEFQETASKLHLFDDKNLAQEKCGDIKASLKALKETVKDINLVIALIRRDIE